MRKLFIIVIIIVIIAATAWLGYLIWQRLNGAGIIANKQSDIKAEQKTTDQNNPLKQITETSIANFWVNTTTSEIFLINYDGKIERPENLKTKTIASDNGLKNISQVIPSPDGSKVLINLTIFDTTTNLWTPLPAGATAAAWNPNNLPIISYLTNDGLYNLDLKTGKASLVLKLNNRDWQMEWPTVNEIYLKSKSAGNYNSELWGVNLKEKNITRLATPKLSKNILPPKCLNTEKGAYCAIPSKTEITLDNYLKRKIYTNDNIYFGKKLLWRADEQNPIDAVNLSLYKNKLLFINRYDQKVYSLDLK